MNQLPSLRSSLFDDFFRDLAPGYLVRPLHGDPLPQQIKIDVKETADGFQLHAELPGVAKDDIHVSIDGPVVSLGAEIRQHDQKSKDERVLHSERYYGAVSRSVRLPADIDEGRASARFDNGVLTLTLPRRSAPEGSRKLRID
ncbi:MAG TPA: Hsp20 family protein [Roseateles sp.]